MRAMIEAGHVVPVLCHYDAGLAGDTHRSSQSATAPIALATSRGRGRSQYRIDQQAAGKITIFGAS